MTTIAKIQIASPSFDPASHDHDEGCACECDLGEAFTEGWDSDEPVCIVERDGALYFSHNDGPLMAEIKIGATTLTFDGKGR